GRGSAVARTAVRKGLDRDPEPPADVGLAATEASAVQALEDRDLCAGGQLTRLDDLGDGADPGEPAADVGDEQNQAVAVLGGRQGGSLLCALDRQRGGHAGQDDDVVELQDGKEFGGQFWHLQSLWRAVGTV